MSQLGLIQVYAGKNIPAIQRIKLYSPEEWEEFVEEWLSTKKDQYLSIERLGGAGDQGRDVVGFKSKPHDNKYSWDNYQCKHYDHSLMPSDVWGEFGKVCYFTYLGDFPIPNTYYFVAPFGIGTSLSNLLRNPEKLRSELIKNWEKYCQDGITKTQSVKLEGGILEYVKKFDFSIFDKITPLTLVEEHQITRFHSVRFGGGLPERPKSVPAPKAILGYELPYIIKLLKAYSSDCEQDFEKFEQLEPIKKYHNHLLRSRENFHQAEQLKQFSRDVLPLGIFDQFKDEIYSGSINIVEDDHESGFKRVKAAEQEVRKLAITSNPLSLCSTGNDRVGVCHHLANEGKLNWVGEENE